MNKDYDLIIIGSGPAGLTASIYASRFRVSNFVIGQALGGLAFEAHRICNYPTEIEISGTQLVEKMRKHTESFGVDILMDKVVKIIQEKDNGFKIFTLNNKEFSAKTVLLASGTEHRKLNLEDEDKFIGKGISYCATCDAMFYKEKTVAVIGGGNSAHTASLYLSEIAKKVYQIYRGDKLKGETAWIDQVKNNNKIELMLNSQVKKLKGIDTLKKIVLDQGKELDVDGLFIEIGTVPQKELINMLGLEINDKGYVKVGPDQKTSQKFIWAAGDITNGSNNLRQIITASSEGAIAAEDIFKFLQQN